MSKQIIWRIELLGELRAVSGARTVFRFPTYKTGALLAYLAHHRHRTHGRDEMAELLWPGDDGSAIRARLNQAISTLRRQLEPPGTPSGAILISDRVRVGLNADSVVSDTSLFTTALRTSRRTDTTPEERLRYLREAADLYRGELLPGYYEEWILAERIHLAEEYHAALRSLVSGLVARGAAEEALPYAHRLVESDRQDSEGQAMLISLYLTLERPVLALKHYADFERLLGADGLLPSPEVQQLAAEARRQGRLDSPAVALHSTLSATPPPPSVKPRIAHLPAVTGLPPQFTPFFGRDQERDQLSRLLEADAPMLVTLTGPGGIGKTRLALECGYFWAEQEKGAHITAFVSLAEVTHARYLPKAILNALGKPSNEEEEAVPEVLQGLLAGRKGLLVLDNFDPIVEEGATTVQLLRQCVPGLRLLITSRRPLGLTGEQEIALEPLRTPPPVSSPEELLRYPAVQMFVERMQAVRADFQLTPRNAETVARLCHGLEGIPLALELAATWAHSLTPAQMLSRLSRRFDLLVSRRRDIPTRHRTLRAAIEYSYQQLNPAQRAFLARFSVFVGGANLAAVAAVAVPGDVPLEQRESVALSLLTDLREASQIVAVPESPAAPEMRYRMLDSLREFAGEQLNQATRSEAEAAHTFYFTELAEATEAHLNDSGLGEALQRLDADYDNLRAALQRCVARGEAITGIRLAAAIARYWRLRSSLREGREWLTAVLALPGAENAPAPLRARAFAGLGRLAWTQGDYPASEEAHRTALSLRREQHDLRGVVGSLTSLAICAYRQAQLEVAEELLAEVLHHAEEQGFIDSLWSAWLNLGNIQMMRERWEEAGRLYARCLEAAQIAQNPDRTATAWNNLGMLAYYEGKLELARSHFEASLMLRLELGQKGGIAAALLNLSRVDCDANRLSESESRLLECLTLLEDVGDRFTQAEIQMVGALLRQKQNVLPDATRLLAAMYSLRVRIGAPINPLDQRKLDDLRKALESNMTPDEFQSAWTVGSLLSQDEVLRLLRR